MPALMRQIGPAEFPELLKEIPDRPEQLFVRGDLPPEEYKLLCVVGSRATSTYGRRICASLIAGLSKYPIAIISGLALGIDAEAHKAALDVGLKTVAVLPSSTDDASIYPAMNRPLAKRILAQGGALVSESPVGHKAMIHDFPARNRIMAGMSHATLIIEAGEKSGTLITAKLALDYNRDVLAVPHELGKEGGLGANKLLKDGATLVRNTEDILEVLGLTAIKPTQTTLPLDLSEPEMEILSALTEPLYKDDLVEKTELSAQEANVALSSLLIRGLILERLGKIERC